MTIFAKYAALLLAAALSASAASADASPKAASAQAPALARGDADRLAALLRSKQFAAARQSLEGDYERIVTDLITLTEIPAPPFQEKARATAYMAMLKAEGLQAVEMDEAGNVMGLRPGNGSDHATKPLLVVAAHLDTVFPEGTDVKVTREGNTLRAPGIGDDTSSLPILLAFVRAMERAGFQTDSDILFVGDVGEEGPGDLRGMKHLFNEGRYKGRIGAFISFEPGQSGRITNGGTGSKRYKVTFKGPGGHSFGAFGLVNPAFAMGNAMVAMGKLTVPADPKTTYSIGIVEGGTSVNSIPFETAMTVDMRSNGKAPLEALEQQFLATLPAAVASENAARSTERGAITFEAKLIGDRPVGRTDPASKLVRTASATAAAFGFPTGLGSGSTDSNLPMSLGIDAVTLGSGFQTAHAHALDESLTLDKANDLKAMAAGLATVLQVAGTPAAK